MIHGVHWSLILTWIVTVLGWVVVWQQSKKRASESELFQMLSSAEDLICDLQKTAVRLFSINGNHNDAPSLRRELAAGFTRLSHKLRALRQRDGRFDHQKLFLEFKRALTGDMAETKARPTLQMDDPTILKIDDTAATLIDELHRSFNEVSSRHVID